MMELECNDGVERSASFSIPRAASVPVQLELLLSPFGVSRAASWHFGHEESCPAVAREARAAVLLLFKVEDFFLDNKSLAALI